MQTAGKGKGRDPARRVVGAAIGVATAWALLMLLVAGLAPKDVEEVIRFRTLTRVAEPATPDEVDAANDRGLVLVRVRTAHAVVQMPGGDARPPLAEPVQQRDRIDPA